MVSIHYERIVLKVFRRCGASLKEIENTPKVPLSLRGIFISKLRVDTTVKPAAAGAFRPHGDAAQSVVITKAINGNRFRIRASCLLATKHQGYDALGFQ